MSQLPLQHNSDMTALTLNCNVLYCVIAIQQYENPCSFLSLCQNIWVLIDSFCAIHCSSTSYLVCVCIFSKVKSYKSMCVCVCAQYCQTNCWAHICTCTTGSRGTNLFLQCHKEKKAYSPRPASEGCCSLFKQLASYSLSHCSMCVCVCVCVSKQIQISV